ncbi:MAG TPA: EAL domain-containing protein [Pyrinomonadaceae bacterium]|nr:EAL domain-containing protein [Pyrinomonadaceae bacterium]
MEVAEGQRFPQKFIQAFIVLGAGALLFSLLRLPIAQVSFPLFLLTLLAAHTASRFDNHAPEGRWHFPFADSFVFLAMLLFGGEAAVLLAAVVTVCTSLLSGRSALGIAFKSSISVFSAFLVVWTLRLSFGAIPPIAASSLSLAAVNAICIALLIHSAINATVVAVGGAYRINQSLWLGLVKNFFWKYLGHGAGVAAAVMLAITVSYLGMGASVSLGAIVAILAFALRGRLGDLNIVPAKQPPADQQRDKSLNDTSDRFRSAFDYAAIGMALVSSEGRWLQVNRSLCEILGYSERELLSTDFLTVTHPDDLGAALANISQLLKGKTPTSQMEKRYINKSGHEVWVHWSVSLVRDSYSKSVHLIFQIQDITDRKMAEQQLHHDAFHDALTGLPNRALFMDHLKLAIARSQRQQNLTYAVLYLDLDRFKIINDSLGHTIGDQLLVGIADRLTKNLRPGDTVARLGGDEFTVLIEDIIDEKEAYYVAERIQKELSVPFNLSGREVFTTVSMGIAPSSTGYDRAEDILRDADTAMYRAKSLGKARYEIFDKAMHARAINLLQLETDMRRAVEREEFIIHYQPIVALEDFRLRGFEALVRWQHPERGFISPIDFIPVAEETGMIVPLGEYVLRHACQQMQRWQKIFPSDPPMFMSVNLSSKQFGQNDLISQVAAVMKDTGIAPHSLKLEITESVVMENIETATELLRQLRALGVQLSIDDFGTGYSSLSYLHRFPINTLKIDRSFVTRMTENNENMEIVRTIIVLAQNLGMDVVAEGVETNDQLALLRKLGCENGQGYFFSKPVNNEGAEKIICETYSSVMTDMPPFNAPPPGKAVLVA